MRPEPLDFDNYVAARRRSLMRTAYLLTGEHHAAEDLVQATLARTFAAWRRIRDREAIDAYVRRTMLNEHASWWRRAWRRMERTTDSVPERPTHVPVIESSEAEEHLWTAVQGLPPRQRAVVVLRYYEDLSEAEIANVLGCSRGTVKSTSSRALAKLRERLGATRPVPAIVDPTVEEIR